MYVVFAVDEKPSVNISLYTPGAIYKVSPPVIPVPPNAFVKVAHA